MRLDLDERFDLLGSSPFVCIHIACLLPVWTGVSAVAVVVCLTLYAVRMFMSAQKGPLWWAAHHRRHHGYSDTADDVHSPVVRGFWWSHVGWFLCRKYGETEVQLIRDLNAYPELRVLNRFYALPPAALAVVMLGLGGLLRVIAPGMNTSATQMLVWGFFISTVLVYHGTFLVNSLAHVFGTRRFPTKDESRNNLLIALITLGEGWHNNHHYAPSSERQGFYWWEIDVSHYILKTLSWCGLVWDLQAPPSRAYRRR